MFKDVDSLRNYAIYSRIRTRYFNFTTKTNSIIAEKENQNLSNFVAPNIKKLVVFYQIVLCTIFYLKTYLIQSLQLVQI